MAPLSWYGMLPWRVIAMIDTFVIGYLITGSLVWAGSIVSIEVLTKLVLYHVHERVWGPYPVGGPVMRPAPSVIFGRGAPATRWTAPYSLVPGGQVRKTVPRTASAPR